MYECNTQRHQLSCIIEDGGEVLGYLVVDSFVGGRSHSGVRMRQDVIEEELRLLARAITMKYGFLGLPFGGAKAGVIGDPEAPPEEKRQRLIQFGRAIRPLLEKEIFVPAGDMGTGLADIRAMLTGVGLRMERRRLPPVSSGHYTAHSVFACAGVSAEAKGFRLRGARVAIQGFGAVGSTLAGLMHAAGARVVAISTSKGALFDPEGLQIPELIEIYRQWGSAVVERAPSGECIDRESILESAVEVLCPCANLHAIREENAGRIQARVICPGANNPCTPEAEDILERQGILFLPDFVANAGGILGTVMAYASFPQAEIERFIQGSFTRTAKWLVEEAARRGVSMRAAAEVLVERRRVQDDRVEAKGLRADLLNLGIRMHRRGLVPSGLVRLAARPYFRRRMAIGLTE